jgi:hypothetical protein
LYTRVLDPPSSLFRVNCDCTRGRVPEVGDLAGGITRSTVARKVQRAKLIDALSLRTSERLELSNTTPLMVTSWDECGGPGPDGGRTALDEFVLVVGSTLEAWYPERTYVLDGGLYEGLT